MLNERGLAKRFRGGTYADVYLVLLVRKHCEFIFVGSSDSAELGP